MMKNVVQKIQKIPFLFMLVLVFFTCISASAQIQIKGTVVSANDSEPMIGVAILEEGTSNGRITDLNGNYSIQVSNSNATLTASFIGYKTQTVKVNGRSVINFRLEEDTQVLDEVVVVGYGVQRKSDLTGAVASVNSKDLKGLATTDAAAALQGKAAGIQILNSSGAPGSGAEIRVRGYSSNSGNIGPLLIVDGLKVSSIQYLDPGLIESMEVLKDAASAAIYGSEAGNGVVLITTKNGGGKGTGKITYNVRYTMNQLGHVPQLLNAEEFKDWMGMQGYNVEAAMSDAIRDYNWDQNTDTNWFDEFMGTSWSKQHSLSFQGSNDKGQYFANLTYVNQDGIVKGKNDYYERLTAQINADYKIKPWLQVGTNTSIEKWRRGSVSEYGYGSAFEMLLVMDPLTPTHWTDRSQYLAATGSVYDAVQNGTSDTNYRFYGDDRGMYATSYFNTELAGGTPFAQRDKNANNKNGGINVHSTFFANLTPFKGFTFTSRFGTRITQGNTYSYAEPYYITGRVSDTKYSISQTTSNGLYYQWENFANYMTSIGKHSISAMAGMSYIQSESNGTTAGASGEELLSSYEENFHYLDCVLVSDKVSRTFSGTPGKSSSISYFGRLGYTYDDRYSLQANFRADAFDTSKLPADNRWGYFPSLSAGWTLSNEKFFKNLVPDNIVSFAKLRASWGRNGNINVLSGYKYSSSIATGGQWYQYSNGTTVTNGSMPSGLANPNLTWETSDQLDFGLDLRLFNDALTISMDYYKKTTKDLLVDAPCLPETGVSSQMINAGEIQNKGFEFEATYKGNIGRLNYSVSGNFATLKNEVTYLDDRITRISGGSIVGANNTIYTNFEQGMPVWYMRGYKYIGKNSEGQPLYLDKEGNETLTPGDEDQFNIGKGIPDLTYGITINLEYKGFDFSVFGTGTVGNDVYYGMYRTGYNNISKHFYDEAKRGNMPSLNTIAGDKIYWSSSALVFDGSYFKIKQLQLGYTLPKSITKKVFIENLRAYVSLDDFFTFTSYPGLDPEIASRSGNNVGLDAGAYPTMRKMTFGLNVTF